MTKAYVIGEMRPCKDCGQEFPRGVVKWSYCPDCTKKRASARAAKSREKATREAWHKKTGPRLPLHPLDEINEGEARLPGRVLTREAPALRETQITFLPTCSICRCYPAYDVNGVYLCRGQHD